MQLSHLEISKLSIASANMRAGRKPAEIDGILPSRLHPTMRQSLNSPFATPEPSTEDIVRIPAHNFPATD